MYVLSKLAFLNGRIRLLKWCYAPQWAISLQFFPSLCCRGLEKAKELKKKMKSYCLVVTYHKGMYSRVHNSTYDRRYMK